MEQWESALNGKLKITVLADDLDEELAPGQKTFHVSWSSLYDNSSDAHDEGMEDAFGTAGGTLAHAEEDRILFDSAEKWLLPNSRRKPKGLQFCLLPVVLHEMGHVLGLEHSRFPTDVMSPYYVANQDHLTKNDKNVSKRFTAKKHLLPQCK